MLLLLLLLLLRSETLLVRISLVVLHAVGSIVILWLILLGRRRAAVDMFIGQLLVERWHLQRIWLPMAGGGNCLRGRSTGCRQILMCRPIIAVAIAIAVGSGGDGASAQWRRWHNAMHNRLAGCTGSKGKQSADQSP